jgi:hypothetical protein
MMTAINPAKAICLVETAKLVIDRSGEEAAGVQGFLHIGYRAAEIAALDARGYRHHRLGVFTGDFGLAGNS